MQGLHQLPTIIIGLEGLLVLTLNCVGTHQALITGFTTGISIQGLLIMGEN
ncbi:hypothetical protein MNBD_GAMMA20-1626, partial [hydrothermal vent metagenome]